MGAGAAARRAVDRRGGISSLYLSIALRASINLYGIRTAFSGFGGWRRVHQAGDLHVTHFSLVDRENRDIPGTVQRNGLENLWLSVRDDFRTWFVQEAA